MFDPKTKVLVVDDMMTMRKIVTKALKEIGFTDVEDANGGIAAFEKLSSASPPFGLIISDWNMPEGTGIDLLKRVRGDGRFAKLPFILVTAESEKTQVAEAVKSGVSNYVIKPFTTPILRDKLEAVHKRLSGT